MRVAPTPEQQALRRELRVYFDQVVTPEDRRRLPHGGTEPDHTRSGPYRRLVRRLGEDGWLGLGWPVEYGGQGRPLMDQLIFIDEASRAEVPLPLLTIGTVGPAIMRHGTDEQKAEFLPRILDGSVDFAIGYSEPEAGTDLANLSTRASREGDDYVINGQKLWTSMVQYVDYVWLAARTDPEAHRHRGLSVLIVPTDTPGFSFNLIHTVGDQTTGATFYDDVRIPASNRVGPENGGWALMTQQLNRERVAVSPASKIERALEETVAWARSTRLPTGSRVIDQEWVRLDLARVHAKVEFLKLINWRIAWGIEHDVAPETASATKVFGTEFFTEAYRLLLEVVGSSASVVAGSPGAVLLGRLERGQRATLILTFGGGTNEVQRDLIAIHGMGMPRG
ncbi:acyl-CoA dehydrogenase family protein [Nocardioides sp. W7]|uniref:acyl-CoA dehydrogenase family protein n=1 Tax=Nocardioides sp. W7 TaxID=2931390 RepID=UPI001FD1276F|nr:acyl-CoA dehydrogenase family protein [Nocardioides sp. W7]